MYELYQKLAKALNDASQPGVADDPAKLAAVLKSLADCYGGSTDSARLVGFAKGLIGPEAVRAGGVLNPARARSFLSLVFEDPFLKLITTTVMKSLKKEDAVLDVPRRSMRRVPQGQEPGDDDKVGVNEGNYVLAAEDHQLFADLTFDFLRDNQDNPELPNLIQSMLVARFRGEILDLAINGQAPDYAGADAAFLKLNKGWVALAEDAVTAGKAQGVEINPAADGWYASLSALWDKVDDRFRATSVIVMNAGDADTYAIQRGESAVRPDTDRSRKFIGYTIQPVAAWPKNAPMVTPLKNLIMGVCQDIRMSRNVHERKRCIEYTFDAADDFQIAIPEAVVLGTPPAGP